MRNQGTSKPTVSTFEKHEEGLNHQDFVFDDEEELGCHFNASEDVEEPSCSNFQNSNVHFYQERSFETATDQQEVSRQYDSNKKVIDYLNRIGDSGLDEMKKNIKKRNQTKETSYAAKVEEIQNSAKAHILKNYLTSFPNKTQRRGETKNIGKQNHSKNSTSASVKKQGETGMTKDEVVDRILTTSLSRYTEK
uniref:30S ribosomal protein S6 n=1 Tax=Lygus hesperus TaxID=30085 RepID=A0A0A9XL63_LYGHE